MFNFFEKYPLKNKIMIIAIFIASFIPTIIISMIAYYYYYLGIQNFFDNKMRFAFLNNVEIATLYLEEHKEKIKADILNIANDINHQFYNLSQNPEMFGVFLNAEAERANLVEAILFSESRVIARTPFSTALLFEVLPKELIHRADKGEIVLMKNDEYNKVRAIMKIDNFFENTYLLIGRYVDQKIINQLNETKGHFSSYVTIEKEANNMKKKLLIVFILSFCLIITITIAISLKLAKFITKPFNILVEATAKISDGNMNLDLIQVPNDTKDETHILIESFNKMAKQIGFQRQKLINVNALIEERRRFFEIILSELSSGIIAIDDTQKVILINKAAKNLLKIDKLPIKKNLLNDIFPEILPYYENMLKTKSAVYIDNFVIERKGRNTTLFIKGVISFDLENEIANFIFDDITNLVNMQKISTWSEAAKRVAHEIKNPLTPIQLAAERMEKKFKLQVSDQESFSKYISIILQHVRDIEKIISSFADFAKLSKPKIEKNDLKEILDHVISSQQNTFPNIKYELLSDIKYTEVLCDKTQIIQVLINLLKNAAESIMVSKNNKNGKIQIKLKNIHSKRIKIRIEDNGQGISKNVIGNLTEPYVTTKTKGTGLGLSIVKKILEDHDTTFEIHNLDNADGVYAEFYLSLAKV